MDFITLALAKQQAKKYTDAAVGGLSSGFSYKGSVSSFDNLPISSSVGDEYTIKDTRSIVVWDGDGWFFIDSGIKIINDTISSGQLTKNVSIDIRNKVVSVLLIEHNSKQLVYADVKIESNKIVITLRETHNEDVDISISTIEDWFPIDNGVKIINDTVSSGQLTKNVSIDVKNKVISILLIEHNSRQLVHSDVKIESDKITVTLREIHNEDIDISISIL